jgi:hypothetical protein
VLLFFFFRLQIINFLVNVESDNLILLRLTEPPTLNTSELLKPCVFLLTLVYNL